MASRNEARKKENETDPRNKAGPNKSGRHNSPRGFHYRHHFSFRAPRFVPGFHAFSFKIATAALRPRNDTKLRRFYFENRRFRSYSVAFDSLQLRTTSYFSAKPISHVIARRAQFFAPDVAIFDGTNRHTGTKHSYDCTVKFGLRPSEICFAREMQTSSA